MIKRTLTLSFAVSMILLQALNAGRNGANANYLEPAAQSGSLITAPPRDGSEADELDMKILREWQDKRTDQDCARALSHLTASYEEVFGDISPFPAPMPKKAAKILAKIKADTDDTVSMIKKRYNRQRPFRRDTTLKPCIDPKQGKIGPLAYPSGHATISRVFALLLADMVPERKELFMTRADEAALNRVISGVHHPSDIEAGKRLADGLYAQFLKVPSFQTDLNALRAMLSKTSVTPKKKQPGME